MKLYLVRHGIATERIGGEVANDAARPLVDAGRKESQNVALALKKLGVRPDTFITSPLVRARQTAEIFADIFGYKQKLNFSEALAPDGIVSDLYKQINDIKKAQEIFLFGHQPDMTRIAGTMLWAGPDFDMPFKKSGVCRIDLYDCPPTNPGTLKWFITPKIASQMIR